MLGLEQWAAAFAVGLLGGVHCLGMCGGIVGTLTLGLGPRTRGRLGSLVSYQLAYNLGRLVGYAVAGALMGGLGRLAVAAVPLEFAQRLLYGFAALFMLLLGLYLGGWWRGLARLEQWGTRLWKHLEPLARRLLPIRSPLQAGAVGFVWAWIPCGLVYSMLLWSLSAGGALPGAWQMLAFGLGTLPTLLGLGLLAGAAARLGEQAWLPPLAGVLVLGFGAHALWQLFAA